MVIGIFDSGVGGLSVLKKIRRNMPQLDVVYFGDIKHAPYGQKSPEELMALTTHSVSFLLSHGVDHVVSACNSLSVHTTYRALNNLSKKKFGITEMITPTIRALSIMEGPFVILATPATLASRIYQKACKRHGIEATVVAIPDLAGAIEFGAPRTYIKNIIRGTIAQIDQYAPQTVVLSCTHYPLARDMFEEIIRENNKNISLFDPANHVSLEIGTKLSNAKGGGTTRFFISKDSAVFRNFINTCFKDYPSTVTII